MSANNIEYLKTRDIDVNPVQTIKRIYRFISIFSFLLVIFWVAVVVTVVFAIIPGTGIETHPGKELERIRGSLIAYGIILVIFYFFLETFINQKNFMIQMGQLTALLK